jgi:WD40 repeat protein
MKLTSYRWIVYIILLLLIQISANFSDYKLVFEDEHYLLEGIFQVVETDLDHDRVSEFVICGKNYVGEEMFVYWLTRNGVADGPPVVKWQSQNLFEERSNLWVATGKFTADENQLVAVSDSQFYIYQSENETLNLILQENHKFEPLNVSAGDIDGDGRDEMVVARIGKITSKIYDGMVQVWRFKEGKFELMVESGLLGNIRGLTTGDLDGDGKSEIVVEEGLKFGAGNIHVLSFGEDKLTEKYCLKKPVKGAIFSLKVKNFPEGIRLIAGSTTGKVNFFSWENNKLVLTGKELSVDCSLVDLAASDLNNDQTPELLLVGYQQHLMILSK